MLERLKLYYMHIKKEKKEGDLEEILRQWDEEEFIMTVPLKVEKNDGK